MLLLVLCNKLKYDYGRKIIDEWDEKIVTTQKSSLKSSSPNFIFLRSKLNRN